MSGFTQAVKGIFSRTPAASKSLRQLAKETTERATAKNTIGHTIFTPKNIMYAGLPLAAGGAIYMGEPDPRGRLTLQHPEFKQRARSRALGVGGAVAGGLWLPRMMKMFGARPRLRVLGTLAGIGLGGYAGSQISKQQYEREKQRARVRYLRQLHQQFTPISTYQY